MHWNNFVKRINCHLKPSLRLISQYYYRNYILDKNICQNYKKANDQIHDILLALPQYHKTTIDPRFLKMFRYERPALRKYTEASENNIWLGLVDVFFTTLDKYTYQKIKLGHRLQMKVIALDIDLIKEKTIKDEDVLTLLLSAISINERDHTFFDNFRNIFITLRKQTISRIDYWNSDQILLVADIWYLLNDFSYILAAVKSLGKQLDSLTAYQFVQLLFYMSIIRDNNVSRRLEPFIDKIINDINIEELGIISLGLFKSRTAIANTAIIKKIVKKTVDHIATVSDISFNSLLKILSLSLGKYQQQHIEFYAYIVQSVNPYLKKFSPFCLIRIASLSNEFGSYNCDLLHEIVDILCPKLSEIRLKELERFLFTVMNSKFYLEKFGEFLNSVEEELQKEKRINEIKLYPHSGLSCIYYLICMGRRVEPALLEDALKINDYPNLYPGERDHQLLQLDFYVEIERYENYKGCRLSDSYKKSLIKKMLPRIPNEGMDDLTNQESALLAVKRILENDILGQKAAHYACVLPHIPFIGILFCTNEDGMPTNIPEKFFEYADEDLKYSIVTDNVIWNIIVVATMASYLYNSFTLKGEFEVRIRQLQKIGYVVTVVSVED